MDLGIPVFSAGSLNDFGLQNFPSEESDRRLFPCPHHYRHAAFQNRNVASHACISTDYIRSSSFPHREIDRTAAVDVRTRTKGQPAFRRGRGLIKVNRTFRSKIASNQKRKQERKCLPSIPMQSHRLDDLSGAMRRVSASTAAFVMLRRRLASAVSGSRRRCRSPMLLSMRVRMGRSRHNCRPGWKLRWGRLLRRRAKIVFA